MLKLTSKDTYYVTSEIMDRIIHRVNRQTILLEGLIKMIGIFLALEIVILTSIISPLLKILYLL